MKRFSEYALDGVVGYLTGDSNNGPKNILYGSLALCGAVYFDRMGRSFGPGFFSDVVEPTIKYILLAQGMGHSSRGLLNIVVSASEALSKKSNFISSCQPNELFYDSFPCSFCTLKNINN